LNQERLCMGCMKERFEDEETCSNCGFVEGTAPDSPLYLPPRTILESKYLVGRVLGQGGFGITYLAWDINLNIKLAIKEYFPQDLASRAAGHSQVSAYAGSMGSQYEYGLDKFLQEARTLAQFEGHPNIVSVRDFFKANGTAYFVMSYVEGITLQKYLSERGGKLSANQAFGIIMPVLDALQAVHSADVLHRDISPDNIYINQRGQVILIDFGAARQAIGEKGRSLSIILKPGYAPEEQYRSKGVQGPWTDIYAVAATIYHLLTGQQPPEALERLSDDNLVPPSQMNVEIGDREERALLKALAVRGEDRYQSVQDFQTDLLSELQAAAFVTPEKTPSLETATNNSLVRAKSGPPVKLIITIAAAVILVAGSVAAYSFISGSGAGSEAAVQDDETVEKGLGTLLAEATIANSEAPEAITPVEPEPAEPVEPVEDSDNEQEAVPVPEPEVVPEPEPAPEPEPTPAPEPATKAEQEVQNMPYEGGMYSGSLKNSIPHGQGRWSHPGGLTYIGEFNEGSATGYGTLTLPSGDRYVGMVLKGVPHGQGKLTKVDGTVQEGNWVNGTMQ
jgi:serine/threonine protein kinase